MQRLRIGQQGKRGDGKSPKGLTVRQAKEIAGQSTADRQIDPFALFEYVGRLRIGQHGKKKDSRSGAGISREDVKKAVGKRGDFVSASDIFNTLSKEKQESLKEWFNKRVEDERGKPQRIRSARGG